MNLVSQIAVEDQTQLNASRRARLIFFVPFPELILALCFAATGTLIAWFHSLAISLPSGESLAFTGMSYGVPLTLIGLLGAALVLAKQTMRLIYYAAAAFAYAVILITHFNIKLWMNLVNPRLWDGLYWQTDQAVRPLVDLAFGVHQLAETVLPAGEHLYLFAFLAMFAGSIIVHSMQAFIVFRKVIFAAMLVHVFGALAYCIMPALGPFIYEPGANALETARQQHMFGGYRELAAGGRGWIAAEGSTFMFAAVAAMPSLHVASSAVFLHYAWKHARWLGIAYLPLFVFIMFEAVATRWHYWVDVVAGLALTALAIAITTAVFRRIEAHDPAREPKRQPLT